MLDVDTGVTSDPVDIRVEDGRIAEIGPELSAGADVDVLSAHGMTVVPGLIDAHVHITAVEANLGQLRQLPMSFIAARSSRLLQDMLARGFTTVRDVGGADHGFARAQSTGTWMSPRILFGGKALSMTGGHGDSRGPEEPMMCCCGLPGIARIADGIDALRHAARDELRKGADHLKVMAGGGVSSPSDRIDSVQYSVGELEAIVDEARSAGRYVAAHAYTSASVIRSVQAGVRSIEHGNLLTDEAIEVMHAHEAFLVPTLATYWALEREGRELGIPEESTAKIREVAGSGLDALDRAARAGVKIVFGTDLLGAMQRHQSHEFSLRAEVQTPLDVLRSATVTAAELVGHGEVLGKVAEGYTADLLLVDGEPATDSRVFSQPDRYLRVVIQDGRVVLNRLGSGGIS